MVTRLTKGMVVVAMLAVAFGISACGKKAEPPKTAEQQKAEKDAAAKMVRDNPVYGDQFKAMDKAKATADQAANATQKTEEALKKSDEAK